MNPLTPTRLLLLLLAAAASATAQAPTPPTPSPRKSKPRPRPYQPPYNPNVILLDPAHGGQDNGADLGSAGTEKDLNAAFAERLRALLAAKGFTVVLTHAAATDDTTPDQRAEIANRSHAVACIILHATNSGRGIHLFSSSLTPANPADQSRTDIIIPWDSAQAASLPQSLQLANELSTALNPLRVPLVVARASVAPIDSMFCPAVTLEIAPPAANSPVSDDAYQQHIAESVTTALTFWRQHAQDQITAQTAAQAAATGKPTPPVGTPAPKPKPKPKPVIITAPDESPLAPDSPTPKPAPIVRRPPEPTPQPQAVNP